MVHISWTRALTEKNHTNLKTSKFQLKNKMLKIKISSVFAELSVTFKNYASPWNPSFSTKQLDNLVDGLIGIGDKNGDKRLDFVEYVRMSNDIFVDNFAPMNLKRVLRIWRNGLTSAVKNTIAIFYVYFHMYHSSFEIQQCVILRNTQYYLDMITEVIIIIYVASIEELSRLLNQFVMGDGKTQSQNLQKKKKIY